MLSFSEALDFLEEFKKIKGKRAVFRGESAHYSKTLPSIYRQDKATKDALRAVNLNLASHIYDYKLCEHLQDYYGLTLYKGKEFGANNLINPDSDLDARHTFYGLVGLMQHYGIPTQWLDFTRSPAVALTFASTNNSSEIGYVYYGDYWDFELGIMIDLSQFAKDLRSILPLPESRPERQQALAYRPPYEPQCVRKDLNKIEFLKENYNHQDYEYLFPKDALRIWFMGQIVDYYMDYIARKRRFNIEAGVHPDTDDSGLKSSIEHLMTNWDLWI